MGGKKNIVHWFKKKVLRRNRNLTTSNPISSEKESSKVDTSEYHNISATNSEHPKRGITYSIYFERAEARAKKPVLHTTANRYENRVRNSIELKLLHAEQNRKSVLQIIKKRLRASFEKVEQIKKRKRLQPSITDKIPEHDPPIHSKVLVKSAATRSVSDGEYSDFSHTTEENKDTSSDENATNQCFCDSWDDFDSESGDNYAYNTSDDCKSISWDEFDKCFTKHSGKNIDANRECGEEHDKTLHAEDLADKGNVVSADNTPSNILVESQSSKCEQSIGQDGQSITSSSTNTSCGEQEAAYTGPKRPGESRTYLQRNYRSRVLSRYHLGVRGNVSQSFASTNLISEENISSRAKIMTRRRFLGAATSSLAKRAMQGLAPLDKTSFQFESNMSSTTNRSGITERSLLPITQTDKKHARAIKSAMPTRKWILPLSLPPLPDFDSRVLPPIAGETPSPADPILDGEKIPCPMARTILPPIAGHTKHHDMIKPPLPKQASSYITSGMNSSTLPPLPGQVETECTSLSIDGCFADSRYDEIKYLTPKSKVVLPSKVIMVKELPK